MRADREVGIRKSGGMVSYTRGKNKTRPRITRVVLGWRAMGSAGGGTARRAHGDDEDAVPENDRPLATAGYGMPCLNIVRDAPKGRWGWL